MSTRDRVAARNLFFGLLMLTVAVGTGLIVPPSAHAAICNSAMAEIDYSDATGPSTIEGTTGPDVILGSDFGDSIDGRGGNDTICGGEGADVIYGGNGNDVIFGDGTNSGADVQNYLYGGPANDSLHGDIDNDVLNGGLGDDFLYGGTAGDDTIHANDDDALSKDYVDGEGNDGGTGDICNINGSDTKVNCP